jgi:CPA1 family monovalent cation:H+ antiporter
VQVFELVIALLFVGAMLAAVARRLNAPYPALLALAGAALALLPNVPTVTLDPQLALALFVAPVLLDAAFDASPRDLRRNWRVVGSLALLTVGLTVAAVAVVVRWLVPDMPWAAAIALGAIVAPPDASAATAVLRQLHPPHGVMVILEGESLFNDATALLVYRLAVTAAVTGSAVGWDIAPMLLLVGAGSTVLGIILGRLIIVTMARIQDVATAVILQFLTTFAVWLIAERLHLSGIITVVVFAITTARSAPDLIPARMRIPSYAVWEVAVFILNVLAFILVGLQLKPILQRLGESGLITYLSVGLAVLLTAIVVRFVWVMGYTAIARWVEQRRNRGDTAGQPSFRVATVIAWCGMRGIVTLAAALALPDGTAGRFPYRDLILFTAFTVVLGTLVLQGMTVRPLIRALDLRDDGTVEQEIRLARAETARAALAALEGVEGRTELVPLLRLKYQDRITRSEPRGAERRDGADGAVGFEQVHQRLHDAQRRTLSELRSSGVIGDDAFHRVEEELDWAELNAEGMAREA